MTATGGVTPYTWRLAAGLLPLGLMLGAASGDITGTPTEAGQFSITIEVQDSSQPSPQVTTAGFDLSVVQGSLDLYGGSVDKQCTGGATGHFYTELINSRWWLCTPEGNVFWMLGVYEVSTFAGGTNYTSAVIAKYGNARFSFCEAAVRRMKSWGFNAVAEYSSSYCTPVGQFGRPRGNPEKLPFLWLIRPALYSANGSNCQGEGTGHVKALMKGLDRSVYRGFMPATGGFPDVFDSNFSNCAKAKANDHKTEFTNGLANQPWLIGTTIEDTDFLFGFGPGTEFPGSNQVRHIHLSWVVFATCPDQISRAIDCGAGGSLTYTDTTVYTKLAFRDFMQNRYGTIDALNSAWGTTYTTFDSNGGWPTGSGLLDENGDSFRCPVALGCMNATMQQDFDDFLEFMADRYFSDVVGALRAELPNKLIFGPAPLNSHQGMTRRPILRAAGRYLDVLQVQVDPDRPQIIVETYGEAPIPQTSWTGYSANADSNFSWANSVAPNLDRPTQEARGQQYATQLDMMINTTTASGIFPSIGVHWWEWAGKANEHTNWGLVSQRDNAYDGKEAIIAPGTDPWGFPTGDEAADYGDAISAIRAANLALYQKLLGGIP